MEEDFFQSLVAQKLAVLSQFVFRSAG